MAKKKKKRAGNATRRIAMKVIGRWERISAEQMDKDDLVDALVDARLDQLEHVGEDKLEDLADEALEQMASHLE